MTLFTDPLRWAKALAGSWLGLDVAIAIHLVMFGVTWRVLRQAQLDFLLVPIFLIGIVLPFMYLYRLHIAIKKLDIIMTESHTPRL